MVKLLAVAIFATALFVWVWFSPLFKITNVTVNTTEHTAMADLAEAVAVSEGTTLLSLDENALEKRVLALPWIDEVQVDLAFPHTLRVVVHERTPAAVVLMTNGQEAWYLASDGTWLEQVELQEVTATNGAASPTEQASAIATEQGLAYVCDLGEYAQPVAGEQAEQDVLLAVLAYLEGFSSDFAAQITKFSASSTPGISAVLGNDITVSLGSPVDIELKEQVIQAILAQYAGQVTYINVRTPTMPTWRGLDADTVGASEGSGDADADDEDGGEASGEVSYHDPDPNDPTAEGSYYEAGGYYDSDGDWIWAYYDSDGTWICGYYDEDGHWNSLA